MPDPLTCFRRAGAAPRTAPRPLARDVSCRACGRPAFEGCACPYCGERAPLARGTAASVALFVFSAAFAFVRSPELHALLGAGWPGAALSFVCGAALSRNRAAAPSFTLAAGASAVLAARFACIQSVARAAAPLIALPVLAALPAQPPAPFASKRAAAAWTFALPSACACVAAVCARGAFSGACAVPCLPAAACLGAVVSRMDAAAATASLCVAAFFFTGCLPCPAAFCLGAAAGGVRSGI